jgi:hypothetical protein|tara:strand:+ start:95 stop:325 length:231 start_codon:yes stop_codon:yes gene_type:complete
MNKHINNLHNLYAKWLEVNNLPQTLSAEDLLYNDYETDYKAVPKIKLDDNQKEFLISFINIWSIIDNTHFEEKENA